MSGDRRRVLVVEDDHDLARAVSELLEQDGFDVDLRFDGDSGLSAGLEGDYDVIVLDIMMPKRSGFRVCQDLRGAGVNTPLLMLTAKEGEWDEVEGLDVGADDFLRKPFERAVLLARLHALVRRFERGRPAPLVVGDVALDSLQRSVVAYGRLITLTPREFSLLEYLMGRVGVETPRGEILDAVWGADFDGDHNVVEVYIGYLRRKIDVEGQPSFIRTVRGVGYTVRAR